MRNKKKPGQIAEYSGQYALIGRRGARKGVEVTVVKGEPMPPTPNPGMSYKLVDKTKHRRPRS